jgi:cytochrome c553
MRRPPLTAAGGWLAALTAALLLLAVLPSKAATLPDVSAEQIAAGKRLYREGRTGDGTLLRAAVRSDVAMRGAGLACTNCHRRSGLGSSEGGIGIPPIAGNTLFMAQSNNLVRNYSQGELSNISRPAYTLQTLARALREGINSSGAPMSPLMPRFDLSDADIAAVAAFLRTLSAAPAEGITEHEMHFATVLTPDATPAEREAMLEVMKAYFVRKNAGTRGETRRAERAPFHKEWTYSAYRKWVLHEWTLSGPPATWDKQLDAFYRKQPVFVLLGGIGRGEWQPVHDFCERRELPCLFPHLNAPPPHAERDFYSVYFSRGLRLEAEALAAHWRRNGHDGETLLQVYRAGADREAAVALLRAAVPGGEDHRIAAGDTPDAAYWKRLLRRVQADRVVLWLEAQDLDGVAALEDGAHAPAAIYASSTLLPDPALLPAMQRLHLLHPYQLPGQERQLARLRVWAKQAGIQPRELRVQADAYFAVTLAGEALMHIRSNLSRDYLIERIEHMTDSMLYTSTYPRLSLAPGQRYAAKGAYIWHLAADADTAQWVVP